MRRTDAYPSHSSITNGFPLNLAMSEATAAALLVKGGRELADG